MRNSRPGVLAARHRNSSDPSTGGSQTGGGVTVAPMPTTEPSGFTRLWAEDFQTPSALGTFTPFDYSAGSDAGRLPVGHPYRGRIKCFVDNQGYPGDQGNGRYYSSKVLSTHNNAAGANGVLDHFLHFETVDGASRMLSGWTLPDIPTFGEDYTYGRFAIRMRADYAADVGGVHLLISRTWPSGGELDFPEGPFQQAPVHGFNHFADPAANSSNYGSYQTQADTAAGTLWQDWHTYVIEWTRGLQKWYVDGVVIYSTTDRVPAGPQQYVTFQSGINAGPGVIPAAGTQCHVQIDWATTATWNG